jgi:hypothetical protein
MRPTGQSLITKGIQAIEKGLSLATKGILDRPYRKGAESETRDFFSIQYLVKGRKKLDVRNYLSLIGIKQYDSFFKYFINGIKEMSYTTDYQIKGRVAVEMIYQYLISARRQHKVISTVDILAKLQTIYINQKNITGIRQIKFESKTMLKAAKLIKYTNDTIKILGKRDITNILRALNLFEE